MPLPERWETRCLAPCQYVPDQEAKSLAQAAKIKAVNPDVLLFPYITGFLAQNSFKAQEAFNQPEHAAWWLRGK